MGKHHHLYDYWWQQESKRFLRNNPLCVECYRLGRLKAATEVDHVEPHNGDVVRFRDKSNWQSMCKSCHSRKTAREDGAFGNVKGDARARGDCGLDGHPVDPGHHWNRGVG